MPAIGAISRARSSRADVDAAAASRRDFASKDEAASPSDWLSDQSAAVRETCDRLARLDEPMGIHSTSGDDEVKLPRPTGVWRYQEPLGKLYRHTYSEIFVAALIVGNFLMNMVEKTFDPDPDDRSAETLWVSFEYFFNIAFFIELLINMYSFWLKPFWSSGWNIFDFVVVSIGMLSVCKVPLPGPLKLLRMMRAFRVFRLFKRVASLKKILESLAKAVPGVVNAFVILVLIMCIYAILGVEFFRTYGEGGTYLNEDSVSVNFETARGQDYGWEYFGNFPKSLFTMFQVLTGESWSEAICRPLLHGADSLQSVAYGLFFVSFVVLNGIILINVVVAVLLEKMVDEPEPMNPEEYETAEPDVATLVADVSTIKANLNLIEEQVTAIVTAMQRQRPGVLNPIEGLKPPPREERWGALDMGAATKPPEPPSVDGHDLAGATKQPQSPASIEDATPAMELPGFVNSVHPYDLCREPSECSC